MPLVRIWKNGFCYNICEDKRQVAYQFYLIRWYNVGDRSVINPVRNGNLDPVV